MIKNYLSMICVILCEIVSTAAMAGDPALPGHHPLTQSQAGSLLISELRCAACHAGVKVDGLPEKTAPKLTSVGTRISADYLRRFLASPLTMHPGTTMPDMLASKPESERLEIAEALTHFLVAQSSEATQTSDAGKSNNSARNSGRSSVQSEPSEPVDRQKGKELFHSIGCVACHGPKESIADSPKNFNQADEEMEEDDDPKLAARRAIKPTTVRLDHVALKYSTQSLSEFLFEPLKVRSSGRMPDMKLTPAESLAIANYLVGDQVQPGAQFTPEASLVEAGKRHFQELNCSACHLLPGHQASELVGALHIADLARGCLSKSSPTATNDRSPRFDLDTNQVAAIAAAFRDEKSTGSVNTDSSNPDTTDSNTAASSADANKVAMAKTLTAFRCIACHVRDDYGGVHDAHNSFFKGSELNLGDDGRIPPPLTLMGAKLKPTWMKKVLFDGESVRYYMVTRMPQYGSANLEHLPGLFRRLDTLKGPEMTIPSPEGRNESERQHEKLVRAAGRELLGDKGANCVACHQFNGKGASVNQGIDLLTSYERLQPEWFNRYLRNPGAFRPRTVMPTAWPDGIAAFTTILDGNTDRQIESIWYYLSLGTSAADPSGVRSVSTKIQVGDQAVIHRGRSRVAGFRGIAVGLPEKMNYAFIAETGTISAIWSGEFIGVNWSGQGSGDFNPASEPLTLPQDVSFVALADENAPWPLLPVMTKEAPVNPDPLYPKNVGYQFRGYYLDDHSIPTFQYRSGTVEIEDRTMAISNNQSSQLKRILTFDSNTPQTIWFRALVGEISADSDQVFRNGRLQLTIPATESKLRSSADDPKRLELLLRLTLPQGKSTLELQYELLKK